MSIFTNKAFFEQTRADGSKYFYASVQTKEHWFFGLIPHTTTYWVHLGESGTPFLLEDEQYSHGFDTLRAASSGLNKAIHRKEIEIMHSSIVGYRPVDDIDNMLTQEDAMKQEKDDLAF